MEIKEVALDVEKILNEFHRIISEEGDAAKEVCNGVFLMVTHTLIKVNLCKIASIKSDKKLKKEVDRILKIIGVKDLVELAKFSEYLNLKTQEFVSMMFQFFLEERFGAIDMKKALEDFKKMRQELSPESMPVVH